MKNISDRIKKLETIILPRELNPQESRARVINTWTDLMLWAEKPGQGERPIIAPWVKDIVKTL